MRALSKSLRLALRLRAAVNLRVDTEVRSEVSFGIGDHFSHNGMLHREPISAVMALVIDTVADTLKRCPRW